MATKVSSDGERPETQFLNTRPKIYKTNLLLVVLNVSSISVSKGINAAWPIPIVDGLLAPWCHGAMAPWRQKVLTL